MIQHYNEQDKKFLLAANSRSRAGRLRNSGNLYFLAPLPPQGFEPATLHI